MSVRLLRRSSLESFSVLLAIRTIESLGLKTIISFAVVDNASDDLLVGHSLVEDLSIGRVSSLLLSFAVHAGYAPAATVP